MDNPKKRKREDDNEEKATKKLKVSNVPETVEYPALEYDTVGTYLYEPQYEACCMNPIDSTVTKDFEFDCNSNINIRTLCENIGGEGNYECVKLLGPYTVTSDDDVTFKYHNLLFKEMEKLITKNFGNAEDLEWKAQTKVTKNVKWEKNEIVDVSQLQFLCEGINDVIGEINVTNRVADHCELPETQLIYLRIKYDFVFPKIRELIEFLKDGRKMKENAEMWKFLAEELEKLHKKEIVSDRKLFVEFCKVLLAGKSKRMKNEKVWDEIFDVAKVVAGGEMEENSDWPENYKQLINGLENSEVEADVEEWKKINEFAKKILEHFH